jgi:hypothetical protein
MRLAAGVLVALEPGEAGDLVATALPVWEGLVELREHLLRGIEAIVVLLPRVPGARLRFLALLPGRLGILVAAIK